MPGAALVVSPPASAASTCPFALPSSASYQNVRTSLSFRLKQRPLGVCHAQQEQDYIVYDAKKSVFPAEACEELGGDSCEADGIGPEVKGSKATGTAAAAKPTEGEDREYVEYKENKTVFPGEACDDLGGEFCEPEYQSGVYPDKAGKK